MHVDEVGRLLDADLPDGEYETISGLVIAELQRLPTPGDTLRVVLPREAGADEHEQRAVEIEVLAVERRVPEQVRIRRLVVSP
jgi:CBS domain containing-hemolysin-like protein